MQRVLIANRGEVAVRIVRACRELGLESVAVYSTADEQAQHVRMADSSVCIGKPAVKASYLNSDALLGAAKDAGADALHPGYGFLSENAQFAAAVQDAGLTWIGPRAETIEQMGDKAAARALAQKAGVPVVPGSPGSVGPDEVAASGAEIGYPILVKAAAGGGGRGIKLVQEQAELEAVASAAAKEAGSAFGDPSIYLERKIIEPRHVEVQVLGDGRGGAIHVLERGCSLQRRRQKLLEECPAPELDPTTRQDMCAAAVRLAREVSYAGAGTVEFVVDAQGNYYFIEMNTRIQVEHPVTEMVTGTDLVSEQLRIARGDGLSMTQSDVHASGWAIEFRINAEDPGAGFMPSPGVVESLSLPAGPGVRVDSALYPGYRIPPFYDSLIAKLIVWGRDRQHAITRGRRALGEFQVQGVKTTVPFHQAILEDPRFLSGHYHTETLAA